MAVGGKKARDADRDRAIDLVKAAWVEGQITATDRDLRVERLLAATTLAQVHGVTTDLQSTPDPTPDPTAGKSSEKTQSSPSKVASDALSATTPRPRWGRAAAATIAIAAVFVLWSQLVGSNDSTTDSEPFQPPVAWSEENVTALTEALTEEHGSAIVFYANFADYGTMVGVPIDAHSQKMRYLRWDGRELTEAWGSQADSPRFDLNDVDSSVMERLLDQAENLIDDPVESSVRVQVRDSGDGRTEWYHATAKSDYSEYGYVDADQQGRVLSTSTDQPHRH